MCWTKGCKFNDDFYLRQWIEYHYQGRHEELKQRLIPLVVDEFKKRAKEEQRPSLEACAQAIQGGSTDGNGESSLDGESSM